MGYYEDSYFLGSRRREPECEILWEKQHPCGAWISVVKSLFHKSPYMVCRREHRRERRVMPIMPKSMGGRVKIMRYYLDDGKTHMDHGFDDWEYQSDFGQNLDAANAYAEHVLAVENHYNVPEPFKGAPTIVDSQKQKVYDWEKEFYKSPQMDRTGVVQLIREIENDLPVSNVDVRIIWREGKSCWQKGFHEVQFASWGYNRDVVVHEMAHWVTGHLHNDGVRDTVASHGAEFVGLFMLMLERYCGVCLTDMINSAVEQKVKFVFPKGGLQSLMKEDA